MPRSDRDQFGDRAELGSQNFQLSVTFSLEPFNWLAVALFTQSDLLFKQTRSLFQVATQVTHPPWGSVG